MGKRVVRVSAPGKIILSGEHAVVYGYPAIATAIDRRLTIFKSGNQKGIVSDIPIGSGMGSSAALAVASAAYSSVLKENSLDLGKINSTAYKMEKKRHGNPSGIDNTVVTYGGFLWYRKETEGLKTFSDIKIKRKLPRLFLIDTGRPKETTKEMVSYVSGIYKAKSSTRSLLLDIERVTKSFLKFLLREENSSFRELITENEKLLERLGVVSDSTLRLVKKIERIGGAAKVSGAGGKKGASGILLVYHPERSKLLSFTKSQNLGIFSVELGKEGVKVERNS